MRYISDGAKQLALSTRREKEPAYQCATCGAWVSIEQPMAMRIGGRLYVGRPCPNCGSFVGISLPGETRRVEFIPEEDKAKFERENGMKLSESNRIQGPCGKEGYAVLALRPAIQDYVDMLAEQGAVIVDGEVRGKPEDLDVRKEEMIEVIEKKTGRWL